MDDTDPYFCVQDEVFKNIQLTKTLYDDWRNGAAPIDQKLLTKIRQAIKNIEWDLIDLQETIGAVENNPTKFHLCDKDVSARRQFLTEAKNVVKNVKNHINASDTDIRRNESSIDFTVHIAPHPSPQPSSVLCNGDLKVNDQATNKIPPSSKTMNSYTTATSNIYSMPHDPLTEQKHLLYEQDNRLDQLGTTISNLKGMSQRIGDELGDQVVLLDDFNNEMVSTESRLDSVTKRTARLLHLSTDRRQWCAIFSLLITLIIILILFAIL
ncbi:Syntaxin-6 [Schistosoma japonicum]|uniref:SJCHGC04860 protein n=1 Tax=Schistosoma japonicum TaxID=6182 RepID=Q5D8X2_SCHJA|nr:SJCHGC04860 protein [Schistosoma japonicum]KAH8872442.1 Syntaxin-6 [Schistosoma japonicum]CAX74127.1 Syntaxin 6 [Schistosoma japonicum]